MKRLLFVLLLLFYGCAINSWTKNPDRPPLRPEPTVFTNVFPVLCGMQEAQEAWVCVIPLPGNGTCRIYVAEAFPSWVPSPTAMKQCLENHGKRHCQGDDHPKRDRPQFAVDCGDGTML